VHQKVHSPRTRGAQTNVLLVLLHLRNRPGFASRSRVWTANVDDGTVTATLNLKKMLECPSTVYLGPGPRAAEPTPTHGGQSLTLTQVTLNTSAVLATSCHVTHPLRATLDVPPSGCLTSRPVCDHH